MLTTNQVFMQAIDDEMIARSPLAKLIERELPSDVAAEEMHFLTAIEVDELASKINPRFRAAIYLASYGGLRAGELWALTVDRVDTARANMEIKFSASEAGGWHVGPTKTGKARTITMPRILADVLDEHINTYSSEYVFTAAEGGPVLHHNFKTRHYTKACIAAGLGAMVRGEADERPHYEGVRFHDLRHTAATLLLAQGIHPKIVSEMLGHSQIAITLDLYSHVTPTMQRQAAEAMNRLFARANASGRD
jgi:integrase